MSKILINKYYSSLDRVLQFGKTKNEGSISIAFLNLLNEYARKQNYEVIHQATCMGTKGKTVRPDGILKNAFGLDIGLWESKDEQDTIDDEIDAKIKKGYPLTNILFEDSQTAVLFQRGMEVERAPVRDADKLHNLLTTYFSFKSDIIYKFEVALEKFKADIPTIVETLRHKIEDASKNNQNFIAVSSAFLDLCKAEINPDITEADIREMMIQHILTSDIFNKIFDDPEFHRHNNIARELEKLIETLFNYAARKNLMAQLEHYYDAMNAAAASVTDHHEKQKFLKVLYENFYKVYNPKAADRLGVVYTPNEIVKFMIESTDFLLHKHFNKTLADKNVEILDPATGTATFITSIIDYLPNQTLVHKYQNELHANEVAILPYYVANLNVEFTFKQKMGYYEEYKNLCFVDTLDNINAFNHTFSEGNVQKYSKPRDLFAVSKENTERIIKQNNKKISVIIGNPPYNANQLNENENNKNREYPFIDKRIKDTYIKQSTAQKTKVYDMYARFYRWSMDRVDKNGIIAFITNRSFIDSRTFDGFRKCIQTDFSDCYIIDTKSDVRANPKIAGTTHNVFGIQTGVAIMFLVKKTNKDTACNIRYVCLDDFWLKEEKLEWIKSNPLENINFATIHPDKNNNWINLSEDNDWDSLLPVCSKDVKAGKSGEALFELFSTGIVTARDNWVYDESINTLKNKVSFFIDKYNAVLKTFTKDSDLNNIGIEIKWSRNLKNHLQRGTRLTFSSSQIIKSLKRPFYKPYFYFEKGMNDEIGYFKSIVSGKNKIIGINNNSPIFNCLANDSVFDFASLIVSSGQTQCLPLFKYDKNGKQNENITDWGLQQFQNHYDIKTVSKEDIFHYVYAILHNPTYRTKYELNLKREFPRIPFYDDFGKWAAWGKTLMELHIGFETVEPYKLKVITTETKAESKRQKEIFSVAEEPEVMFKRLPKIKPKLKADKEAGIIEIDEITFIKGVPAEAWQYKLGNRSALEWILDQYKEKKPSDPTIAEKFNTYRIILPKIRTGIISVNL